MAGDLVKKKVERPIFQIRQPETSQDSSSYWLTPYTCFLVFPCFFTRSRNRIIFRAENCSTCHSCVSVLPGKINNTWKRGMDVPLHIFSSSILGWTIGLAMLSFIYMRWGSLHVGALLEHAVAWATRMDEVNVANAGSWTRCPLDWRLALYRWATVPSISPCTQPYKLTRLFL